MNALGAKVTGPVPNVSCPSCRRKGLLVTADANSPLEYHCNDCQITFTYNPRYDPTVWVSDYKGL